MSLCLGRFRLGYDGCCRTVSRTDEVQGEGIEVDRLALIPGESSPGTTGSSSSSTEITMRQPGTGVGRRDHDLGDGYLVAQILLLPVAKPIFPDWTQSDAVD